MGGRSKKAEPIRVIHVEDNEPFRKSIARELAVFPQLQIVDDTGTSYEASRLLAKHTPDVAIVDISIRQLPGDQDPSPVFGLLLIREIRRVHPATRTLVLSHLSKRDPDVVLAALKFGAGSYVDKDEHFSGDTLLEAITATYQDEPVFSRNIARVLLDRADECALNQTERDVIEGLASHKSLEKIASDLEKGYTTVVDAKRSALLKFQRETIREDVTEILTRCLRRI